MSEANESSKAEAPVSSQPASIDTPQPVVKKNPPVEIGGRGGLDPVRYGDWEKDGRCIDF